MDIPNTITSSAWEISPETLTPAKTTYLPALRYNHLSGNSNQALRTLPCGNQPKRSPFANNFTDEIDTLALKRYFNSCRNPQKVSTSKSPRKSTSRHAREASLAVIAANTFPVNRRRAQPQTHSSGLGQTSQSPDENVT